MQDLVLASYNVNGMNIPQKRNQILRYLKLKKVDISFIQETHFKKAFTPQLKKSVYSHWFYSNTPLKRRKGVAILIHKNLNFVEKEKVVDEEGRYLFIKGCWKAS